MEPSLQKFSICCGRGQPAPWCGDEELHPRVLAGSQWDHTGDCELWVLGSGFWDQDRVPDLL